MSKRCEKYFGVFLPALIAFVPAAQAATCAVAPTCEQLGYVQSSSDCAGAKNILKCPFDLSKLFAAKQVPRLKLVRYYMATVRFLTVMKPVKHRLALFLMLKID